MTKKLWAKVTIATIRNCWKKRGFTNEAPEDVIISLPTLPAGQNDEELRNWVSIDVDVQTVQECTKEEFTEELVPMIRRNDGLVIEYLMIMITMNQMK